MKDVNYFLAIGYALIGWVVQVVYYYFQFDTDEGFDWRKFWRTYDKYIILGFVCSIAFALLGDFGWPTVTTYLGVDLHYDERFSILLGIFSLLIFLFLSRKARKKFEENQ